MKVMGIESSCDETGVGIVELDQDGHMEIIANAVASSMQQHARFGGVVPEIASRAHLEAMPQVMRAALAMISMWPSCSSSTMPTPVSSQEDSMPMTFITAPLLHAGLAAGYGWGFG